jgi:hypothetical protein
MPALPNTNGASIAWAAYPEATLYAIGIASGPGQPAIQRKTTTATSITISGLASCVRYYYQVVALPMYAVVEDGYFTTVRPAVNLQTVISGEKVSFSWTQPCGSLWNDEWLDVGTSPGTYNVHQRQISDQGIAWYDLPMSLLPGTYYWRVNTRFGYTWFPSENKPFTITAPAPKPATNLVCSS